jgi:Domain of unknown function (DUF4105)
MILVTLLLSLVLHLEVPPEPTKPDAWIMVVDPGTDLFTRFGHSAFLLRYPGRGATIYDFGNFDFDNKFMVNFLKGTAYYYLARKDIYMFMEPYENENREIRGHLLDLSTEKVNELRDILNSIYNSEERHYKYDHFNNNCATQMLHILSRLFKGEIENSLEKIPIVPWRENLVRVLGNTSPLYWGLRLGLSSELDSKRNAWNGSFLPLLLEKSIMAVSVSETPFGQKKPLIIKTIVFSNGIKHNDSNSPGFGVYVFLIFLLLFLFLLPFIFYSKPLFFKIAVTLYSIISLVIFSSLIFFHIHLKVCEYNLNILGFFPFMVFTWPWLRKNKLLAGRGVHFLAISALFPLLELFLRIFTIQRTAPFPEIAFTIHLIFIAQWMVIYKFGSKTHENPEKEMSKEEISTKSSNSDDSQDKSIEKKSMESVKPQDSHDKSTQSKIDSPSRPDDTEI